MLGLLIRARPLPAVARLAGHRALHGATRKMAESLIPETLREMDAPGSDFAVAETQLREVGRERLTVEERKRRRRALDALGVEGFVPLLASRGLPAPTKGALTTLQVNVGLYCNQACTHCHVESSPRRKETMSLETVAQVLRVLDASPSVSTVDITGGAPGHELTVIQLYYYTLLYYYTRKRRD